MSASSSGRWSGQQEVCPIPMAGSTPRRFAMREPGASGVPGEDCGIFPQVDQDFSSPVAASCPCCGGSSTHFLEAIPYREIWLRLGTEGAGGGSPGGGAAGDEDFYRELGESPLYYASWKWEFGWVKERIRPGWSVLDVGCGRGDFLLGISELAGRIAGVERNPLVSRDAGARR